MNSNTYVTDTTPNSTWIPLDDFCLKYKVRRRIVKAAIDDGKLSGLSKVVHNKLCLEEESAVKIFQEYKIDRAAQASDIQEVGAILAYEESKAREKEFKAKIQELDYKQRIGELIERAAVEKELFEMARKVRNNIMTIPSKVMDQLAATTDPYEVEKILLNEIHLSLEGLANELR